MASEWTVVLRFNDGNEPNEEEFSAQVEEDWDCNVMAIEREDV